MKPDRAFRTAYGPKLRQKVQFEGESMTQIHQVDETDVNKIVAKFQQTGIVDHVATYGAQYGEVSDTDFTQAMMIVTNAQEMFDHLPSKTRDHFDHDPAKFLAFVDGLTIEDQEGQNLAYELGLTNSVLSPPEPPQIPAENASETPENGGDSEA